MQCFVHVIKFARVSWKKSISVRVSQTRAFDVPSDLVRGLMFHKNCNISRMSYHWLSISIYDGANVQHRKTNNKIKNLNKVNKVI